MSDPKTRQRFLWIAAIGGAVLVCLVFVSFAAPSRPGVNEPTLRPSTAETPAASSLTGNEEPESGTDPAATGGFSLGAGDAASLAWRLGLVAVIIAASIAGLRWWGRKAGSPSSQTGYVRIIDTLGISNGRTIHLLALGERVIVVGATAQQLTFLSELDEEEARKLLAQAGRPADTALTSFASELFQSMRRGTGATHPHERAVVIGETEQAAGSGPGRG